MISYYLTIHGLGNRMIQKLKIYLKIKKIIFQTTPRVFCSAAGTNGFDFVKSSGFICKFLVLQFSPPTESDTMQLRGQKNQVTTKQMSICAMEEYENRSLEVEFKKK